MPAASQGMATSAVPLWAQAGVATSARGGTLRPTTASDFWSMMRPHLAHA